MSRKICLGQLEELLSIYPITEALDWVDIIQICFDIWSKGSKCSRIFSYAMLNLRECVEVIDDGFERMMIQSLHNRCSFDLIYFILTFYRDHIHSDEYADKHPDRYCRIVKTILCHATSLSWLIRDVDDVELFLRGLIFGTSNDGDSKDLDIGLKFMMEKGCDHLFDSTNQFVLFCRGYNIVDSTSESFKYFQSCQQLVSNAISGIRPLAKLILSHL